MGYANQIYPAGNYIFKVNNRNTRTRCEISSKLTIKTLKNILKYYENHRAFGSFSKMIKPRKMNMYKDDLVSGQNTLD